LLKGLREIGIDDAEVLLSGSAVTGRSFNTGKLFDVGRVSDFDVAIVSQKLMQRSREVGAQLRSRGIRTEPLELGKTDKLLRKLNLHTLAERFSLIMKRKVNFMIYESASDAIKRAPSMKP
jgi:predicted nucleotidyltransferase